MSFEKDSHFGVLILSDFVGNGFDVFCQKHTHIIHVCARGIILKWLNQQPQKYAFAEPIVFQQGAIEYTYKLVACLFTSVSK